MTKNPVTRRSRPFLIFALCVAIGHASPSVGQQFDHSGKGAVLCDWEIAIGVRNAIDVCFPEEFAELRAELSITINAINEFIVANNPSPITKAELEARVAQRLAKSRSAAAADPRPVSESLHCQYMRRSFILPMDENLKKTSPDERRRALADFLSVPRVPVMNPCL
jgi:hypothetical protein